ncbi:CDGSH iron-sulfur domain-containing protein [Natronosalvus caseinilyticus]|uniref:CDGSH iron-sulfur domain-containing protein n=1 Tax=Natronosalvus caseinilyticus TaxID=2953747 RepID=UPI0028AE9C6C|nr:CDGSH iron-sulfur domain-containing protein [Natronosalvus caseinilyticus]
MARLVRHDATGPRKLEEDDIDSEKGNVAICQCGLAETYPFCDGTHRTTRDERADELYVYETDEDDDRSRRVVEDVVCSDE